MCQPGKQFNKCHRSALGRHDGLSKCFQGWRETHLCSDEAADCYLADQSLTDVTRRDVIHHTHRSSCRSSLTSLCPQTLTLKSLAIHQSNNTGDLHQEICAAQFYHERNKTERRKVYPEAHNNSTVWHCEMKYLLCDVWLCGRSKDWHMMSYRLSRSQRWKQDLYSWWRCRCVERAVCLNTWRRWVIIESIACFGRSQSINESSFLSQWTSSAWRNSQTRCQWKTHIHTFILILPPAWDDYEWDQFMTSVKSFPPGNTGRETLLKHQWRLT